MANYVYRRSRTNRKGRLYRNVSQRSNSNNSQSANTCSSICSTQYVLNSSLQQHSSSYNHHLHHHPTIHQPNQQLQQQQQTTHSLRYLEADLARLHGCSKRPLVVSFRRIPRRNSNHAKPYIDSPHNLKNSKICDKCTDNPLLGEFKKQEYMTTLKDLSLSASSKADGTANSLVQSHLTKTSNCNSKSSLHMIYDKCLSIKANDDKLKKFMKAQNNKNAVDSGKDDSCESRNSSDSEKESATVTATHLEQWNATKRLLFRNNRQLINMRAKKNTTHKNDNNLIKSPYESPKLSDESKELEEKMNKLLEGIIPNGWTTKNHTYILPKSEKTGKSTKVKIAKSKSCPFFALAETTTKITDNGKTDIDAKAQDVDEVYFESPLGFRKTISDEQICAYFTIN